MYKIKESPIHGYGLFASADIKKGSKICDYYGVEMSWKDFKIKYGDYKKNSLNTYPMRRTWKILVAKDEPYKSENPVNYINESNEPNCILKKRALYSIKDIFAEQEITLLYPKDYLREWLSGSISTPLVGPVGTRIYP
jgi:SET domain-containing protein